jgi:hypothetical protein
MQLIIGILSSHIYKSSYFFVYGNDILHFLTHITLHRQTHDYHDNNNSNDNDNNNNNAKPFLEHCLSSEASL